MNGFLSKYWTIGVIIIIAVITTVFYSFLGFSIKGDLYALSGEKLVFNSPDETANYFFSDLFQRESQLTYQEPDNFIVNGLISPRSMHFINGQVAPASFFGLMILVGALGKIIGANFLIYILPFLTSFSLIYFYLLVKKIFNKEIAFFSTLLAFIFPAYWYYSTRSFFNNVLFLDFLIIGLYYLLLSFEKNSNFNYFLSGLFLAGAVFIRTSEFIWLGILILILLISNWKKINFLNLIIFFSTCLLVCLPIFYYNQIIYGQFLAIGYNYNFRIDSNNIFSQGVSLLQQLFLPFGIKIANIIENFTNYFLQIFWWYFILLELALTFIIVKILDLKKEVYNLKIKNIIIYLLIFVVFSFYLVIFYGSWKFSDHPDPLAVTLGTSYTRYFLPIYIFSLPLISFFIINFFNRFKILKIFTAALIFCLFFYFSFQLVYFEKDEGILKVKKNLEEYQQIAKETISQTTKDSVIIAERNDKIFFPLRAVIYNLNNKQDYQAIYSLLNKRKIYWWRFALNNADLEYLNESLIKDYQWFLEPAIYCHDNQCLYPIKISTENVRKNI